MGWIIAGAVITALALLLMIPLSGVVIWDEGLRLDLKWLFIRKTLYPETKEKKEKEEPEKKSEKKAEPKNKKKKNKASAQEVIDNVLDYIKRCKGGALMILRNIRVSLLKMDWTIAADDCAECAIRYGKMNAYIYGALASMENIIRIKRADIRLVPDFTAAEEKFSIQAVISLTPLIVIIGAVRMAWGFLMKMIADSKKVKQQRSEKNERKKSRGTDGRVNGKPQGAD